MPCAPEADAVEQAAGRGGIRLGESVVRVAVRVVGGLRARPGAAGDPDAPLAHPADHDGDGGDQRREYQHPGHLAEPVMVAVPGRAGSGAASR